MPRSRSSTRSAGQWKVAEGAPAEADQTLFEMQGPARSLLTGERTALNFLQLLSGTATAVHAYASASRAPRAACSIPARPSPGLRSAQKYAVRVGRRPKPSPRAVRRDPDQGKSHHGGGLRRARRGGGEVLRHQGSGGGRGGEPRGVASRRSMRAPTSHCSTISRSRTLVEAVPSTAAPRALEARSLGGRDPGHHPRASPKPASITCPWAASPNTSAPWTCRCVSSGSYAASPSAMAAGPAIGPMSARRLGPACARSSERHAAI